MSAHEYMYVVYMYICMYCMCVHVHALCMCVRVRVCMCVCMFMCYNAVNSFQLPKTHIPPVPPHECAATKSDVSPAHKAWLNMAPSSAIHNRTTNVTHLCTTNVTHLRTTNEASVPQPLFLGILLCSQVCKGINDHSKDEVLDDNDYHNEEEQEIIEGSKEEKSFLEKRACGLQLA